jgi:hypothetical protein
MQIDRNTAAVRRYVFIMQLFGVLFALSGVIFFFFPGVVFTLLNIIPKIFEAVDVLPAPAEYFWLVLSFSMMAMLAVLCFASAADPANRVYVGTILLSKLVSSTGYLYLFFSHQPEGTPLFAYLAGALTDFPIFLFILWLHIQVMRKGGKSAAAAADGTNS